jgi:anaerobic selenocysteine-containing dehydrogenase
MPETLLHTCMLCEATCGITVQVEGGRVTGVRGDRDDPFSRGHICPKAAAIPDVMADPDRIREPMRRVGEHWEPVSWEDALAEAAERITAIQEKHGRHAVGLYAGNPTVHGYGAMLGIPFFSRALGGRSRFSATSVDQLPQMLAALEMFGHQSLFPVPDVDRTDLFLVLGANPIVSNGSLMTAPGIADRLAALRKRGGRLIVVDPRRTETAAIADRHVAVRPGGDAALLLGMLNVIFAEGLGRPGRLAEFTEGMDRLGAIAARYSPERVAARAGVAPDAIRSLAREFAAAPSAVCYGRVGISTQEFGAIASWLVVALNVVTGNLDRPGGAMFTTPAADLVAQSARRGSLGSFGRFRSRVRGLPEFGGELPVATLAEEIETPGEGQIRGLVTFAGNPVLSTPNGGRLDRALEGLEFLLSIDPYRNETTRHANLILPPTFGLERDHYDLIFYTVSVRNVARYARAVVAPPPGVRDDWDILLDLALALQARRGDERPPGPGMTLREVKALGPKRMLDGIIRAGPHGLSLEKLESTPHGIDLGALEPRLPARLFTPDRRIRLVPPVLEADLVRLDAALDAGPEASVKGAMLLVGRRQLRGNNSWMHNSARLVKGPPACTLLLHPEDAAARGIADGAEAIVRSRIGSIRVPVSVTDEVGTGVACLPHGWGHGRDGVSLRVAGARAGVSFNDLADEQRVDPSCGNADFNGVPVTVDAVVTGGAPDPRG